MRVLVLLLALSLASQVDASLIWGMRFQDTPAVIHPTDTVVLKGTLSNSSRSTENLGVIGGFRGNPPGYTYEIGGFASINFPTNVEYTFQWGPDPIGNVPGAFSNQFEGVDLAPGESFDFVFMSFTPRDGMVPLGDYTVDGAVQLFLSTPERPIVGARVDSASWTVTAAVPEPTTLTLLGIGLAGFAATRRKVRHSAA